MHTTIFSLFLTVPLSNFKGHDVGMKWEPVTHSWQKKSSCRF